MHRILVVIVLLAGCSEPAATVGPPCADCDDDLVVGGRDLRTDLLANDTLAAPEWQVGDVFEQHMFFGSDDREGLHVKTIVVEAGRDGYVIATPDEEAARFEAVYDYPVLGQIGPGLETQAFGSDWSWMYEFPLTHGATWTGQAEDVVNWNSYSIRDFSLTLTSSYDDAIDTPHGEYPGFWIEGATEDGDVLARYNYVPAIGWFSHFWLYDIETADPIDVMFHAMSMGTSTNYTGPYVVAEAETVIEHFFGFFPNPGSPGNPVSGDPAPRSFQVPESDRLMGIVVPVAAGGRTEVTIVEPDGGETSYEHQQLNPQGSGFDVFFVDLPAETGQWQSRIVATAAFGGGFVWLSRVAVEEAVLA